MKVCLIFLSGSKKGLVECFPQSPITIGTGRDNNVLLKPSKDKKAGMEHAIITEQDERYYILDRGSKSGTYVNGEKIEGRLEIKDWDVIEIGKDGTRIVFRLDNAPKTRTGPTNLLEREMMEIINASLLKIKGKKTGKLDSSTDFFKQLIERSVSRSTRNFKIATSILTAVLVVVIGLWIFQNIQLQKKQRIETEQRLSDINRGLSEKLTRVESQNKIFSESATARESELRSRIAELEDQLSSSEIKKSGEETILRRELRKVQNELKKTRDELMSNSRIDWVKISEKNQGAVVLIGNYYQIYDLKSGKPLMVTGTDAKGNKIIQIGGVGTPLRLTATGTGFNVDPKGTIFTNKHVIKPWEMEPLFIERGLTGKTLKLQVIFADNKEWIEAEIEKISTDHDIIVLKLTKPDPKGYPYISKFEPDASKLHQGEEIAVIGFPGNVKTDGRAVTTLTVGVLSKLALKTDLQFNAQINPGNSGGPLLNAKGEVIGIVYGAGVGSTGERLQGISYAIPIKYGLDLL